MLSILLETIIDSLKTLPFLFLAYLFIEYIEHSASKKMENALKSSKKLGPIGGALLGCVPQCGFSVLASNLYACRIITAGTLVAVFLSTSDEAIPLMLSNPEFLKVAGALIAVKVFIALLCGFIVDLLMRKNQSGDENHEFIHDFCENCNCEKGIFRSAVHHTVHVFAFIFVVSLILSFAVEFLGNTYLTKILMSGTVFQPIIAAAVGLIPNCAASVILTQLFLSGSISFGSLLAGLLSGAGVGLAVLFKINKNQKENFKILLILYAVSALCGIIVQCLLPL